MVKLIGNIINFIGLFSPSSGAKIAIKLFSSPRKGKIRDEDLQVLESAFYEDINHEGQTIGTYRWLGKKETILLAHGWESNSARWKDLVELLQAQNYTIVCLDAPAHGNSSGREFNALFYAEFINIVVSKFKPEIIVGHSVGGMASVFFQHKYKYEGLQKLVLLGAPAHFKGVFERYNYMMGYSTKINNAMSKQVELKFGHPPNYFDASSFSKEINSPTLIVHDKQDLIIPYEDALLYEKYLPKNTLITTEREGHGLKSETVHKSVISFIQKEIVAA